MRTTTRNELLRGTEDELALDLPAYPGDLTRYWHPVSLAAEVKAEPMSVVLLGRPIVLFRDDEGVVAFRDLCVHRGARLSLGTVTPKGTLQCPYHGWEYDRTGQCVRIPARPPDAPIPRSACALTYRAAERYGLVWVCLEEPAYRIPPFPGGEDEDPAWRTFFAFSEHWATSAGRILENFCDWTHIPFVHDGVLGSHDLPRATPTEVVEHDGDDGFSISYSYDQIDQSDVYGGGGTLSITRKFVVYLPFMAHLYKLRPSGEASLLTMALSPQGPRETTLYLWISRNHDFERPDEDYRQLSRDVFAQDKRVVETQLPEQIPLDLRRELHLKVPDAFSIEYRRVLNRLAAGADIGSAE